MRAVKLIGHWRRLMSIINYPRWWELLVKVP
jgi:hypothetical protein